MWKPTICPKGPACASTEAEILVIQADGKGVPLILAEKPTDKVRLGKGEKRGARKRPW